MIALNGKNIQTLRMRRGLKAKDVAASIGISASYYSELERDKKPIPTNSEFFRNLANALQIKDAVFEGVNGFQEMHGEQRSDEKKLKLKDFIEKMGAEFFLTESLVSLEREQRPLTLGHGLSSDSGTTSDQSVRSVDFSDKNPNILAESESDFEKRVSDLQRRAQYFFMDATELFELARKIDISILNSQAEPVLLKGISGTLKSMQPLLEQGFFQLIKDVRMLRRIAKMVASEEKLPPSAP